MLALAELEAEPRNAYGIPMKDATNPDLVWDVPDRPRLDHSVEWVARKQRWYYAAHDTDKARPMDRSGHLWSVRQRTT